VAWNGSDKPEGGKATSASERPAVVDARYKRVLQAVRAFDVNGRLASAEFEDLPDPDEHPLYYKIIPDPVCLKSLEREAASRKSPLAFASRFDQMVMNAKFYNKPKSTIYKDADRLHAVFQQAMADEFDLDIDDGELDEDADGAWARDLKQRGALAHYERAEFQQAQRAALERVRLAKAHKPTAAELEVKRFAAQPLVIKPMSGKVSASSVESREGLAAAHLALSNAGFDHHAQGEACELCPVLANLVRAKAKAHEVVVPTFREIVPVETRKPALAPGVGGKKRLAAAAVYSPLPRLRAKVTG